VLRLVGAEHRQFGALLRDSPPGARGVAALPFLAVSGERASLEQATVEPRRGYDSAAGYADYVERVAVGREHRWRPAASMRRSA
jgi:hypothetical protein